MDVQVQRFDALNDLGAELVGFLDSNPDAVEKINSQLQLFQERWDNIVHQMEYQSKQVSLPPRLPSNKTKHEVSFPGPTRERFS